MSRWETLAFKGHVLKHLATIDARFPDLVRLVKTWATAQDINDAYQRTSNSFALTMMGFEQRTRAWSRAATTNPETLLQLLSSFFEFYADVLESWRHDLGNRRCSPWAGEWRTAPWPGVHYFFYVASIEDPFDATDNCGRSLHSSSIHKVLRAFRSATLELDPKP